VVAVPAAAQQADRVHPGDDVSGGQDHADDEVPVLRAEHRCEDRLAHIDVHRLAGRVEGEAARGVHPGVRGHDAERPHQGGQRQGQAEPEVRPRLEPAPAVQVDGDEDRLEEERPGLDPEAEAEDIAPPAHHPRPQQTELEGQHGARHDADGELDGHDRRPAPCEQQGDGVALAQSAVVHQERDGGQGHAERYEQDVGGQGEGHQLPGGEELWWAVREKAADCAVHMTSGARTGMAQGP
jgi:hypothetical protein